MFASLFAAVAWFASVEAAVAGGNVISPDGRTLTHLDTNAGITSITTGTVRSGTGFNSFSQFQVGTGNIVNLHVPDAANKLLNIVRDGPVFVDGILNGYKNGQIGGDIYFADPHGFVVGPNGTVNVGSLTVQTPKAEFLDSVIDAQGNIDDAATAALLAGATPISADGFILVQGKINAQSGVHLSGQTVSVGATTPPTTPAEIAKMLFDATVNTAGLKEGAAITVRNGAVLIEAAGDAVLGGTIEANGASDHDAGSVTVTAANDIQISGEARLAAAGGGDGSNAGSVLIKAGRDLAVQQGAVVNVHGKDGGKGGTVELSAVGTGSFAGATLDAGSDHGAAGSILIDPATVVIDSGASMPSNGASVTITATNSITIASGGYINTRVTGLPGDEINALSTGDSGDVSLTAPSIQVDGKIHSFAKNTTGTTPSTWKDGNITLTASQNMHQQAGHTGASTGITINGVLEGGAILLESNASARTEYDTATAVFVDLLESLWGVGAGYVKSTANAAIHINSTASVIGSGDVTLNAWTNTVAKDPVYNVSLLTYMSLTGGLAVPSVVVGDVSAVATAQIGSGATVSSGGALTVRAHNSAELEVSTFTVTTAVPLDVSVAYSTADVQSNALVDSGAHITANSLRLTARNDNSFSTAVSVYDLGDGNAGLAAAIADGHHTSATADLAASPTLTGTFSGTQLLVEANNLTFKDEVKSVVTVGTSALVRPFVTPVQGAINAVQSKSGNKAADATGADPVSTPKGGASTALALDNQQSATARISSTGAEIAATGAVAVIAHVLDQGVRSSAQSAVNSPDAKNGTANNPAATFSISVAFAYADRTLKSLAEIGTETRIKAPAIGVAATTELPITITWLDWDGFDAVVSHINTNLGLGNDVLTSFVNSTADAGKVGFSGGVNYFSVDASATAWVGKGAKLTATPPITALPWSVALDNGNDATHGASGVAAPLQAFSSAVEIAARRSIDTLNFGGNPLFFYSGTSGTSPDAIVFGGTFDYYRDRGATLAGIGSDATVSTGGDLSVLAQAEDKAITISPAGGKGAGINVSGIIGLNDIDTKTHASVASSASILANKLTVDAGQTLSVWSAAGSIIRGDEGSIGIAAADNAIKTHVQALIGDNSADDPSTSLLIGFVPPLLPGVFVTDLSVQATTQGQIGAYGIAGTFTSNNDPKPDDKAGGKFENPVQAWKTVKAKVLDFFGHASNDGQAGAQNADNSNGGKDGAKSGKGSGTPPTPPDFGVAVSGSVGYNFLKLDTLASIDGASINKGGLADGSLNVTAKRDVYITAVAGGAAFVSAKAKTSRNNAAFAGSAAIIISNSTTAATINNSTVTGFKAVTVEALSGGRQVAVAIDLAANWSTTAGSSNYTGAGAASIIDITDSVQASVNTSTIDGPTTGTGRGVVLNAYDRNDIGVGGGAMYLKLTEQNGSSGGVALTYAGIRDPAGGKAVDASLINSKIDHYDTLDIAAANSDRIIAGAAMIAGSQKGSGGEGAIVVNDIDATTNAEISADAAHAATSSVSITGNLSLSATGSDKPALDAILGSSGLPQDCGDDACTTQADSTSPIDFSGGPLGLSLSPGYSIVGVAGTVAISTQGAGKTNIGVSLAVNSINAANRATISGLNVTSTGGDVTVAAGDEAKIIAFAIGVSSSQGGGFAGVGSVTLNFIDSSAIATVGDPAATSKTTSISSHALNIIATNNSTIWSLAGTGVWSQKAFGASVSYNEIANNTTAQTLWSTLTQAGAVNVSATSISGIRSLAATIAVASGWFFAGAATVNIVHDTVNAIVGDPNASGESERIDAGSLTVAATAENPPPMPGIDATIESIAVASIGISFNQITDTIAARVSHAALKIGTAAEVSAQNDASVKVAALGLAFGDDKFAVFAGSVGINLISDSILADWTASSLNDPAVFTGVLPTATLNLAATDNAEIEALAGQVSISGQASGGASLSVSKISNTTTAHIDGTGGSKMRAKDVTVKAASDDVIRTLAIGIAVSDSKYAATGSAATSLISSGTYATIDNGADVIADNNVGVLARNDDAIETIAGAAGIGGGGAGVGISVVVNEISDTTKASIEGASTRVDAQGLSGTDLLSIDSGILITPPDVSSILVPTATAPDLSETQRSVRGLAVVATSGQAAVTNAVTIGVGKTGVSILPVVNIMGGTSLALVDSAGIDMRLTGDPTTSTYVAPDIDVTAASHSYAGNFALGVAAGQNAGAGTATAVTFNRTTDAHITNAQVGKQFTAETATTNGDSLGDTIVDKKLVPVLGNVSINAFSSQSAASISVAGAAGGSGSLTASVVVDLFKANTMAYLTGGTLTAGSLTVKADSKNGANALGGAVALGSGAGGAAVAVITNNDTTLAYVGDRANVLAGTAITPTLVMLSGATDVEASNENEFDSIVVSGAGGYTAGVAAMAAITILNADTDAGLYGVVLNSTPTNVQSSQLVPSTDDPLKIIAPTVNPPVPITPVPGTQYVLVITNDYTTGGRIFGPAGDVTVKASDSNHIKPLAGSVGLGGAGVGIGANVVVLHSTVNATIAGSDVNAAGHAVSVDAKSDKNIDLTAFAGSVGYYAGVSAVVGVILVGTNTTPDTPDSSSPPNTPPPTDVSGELDSGGNGTISNVDSITSSTDYTSANPSLDASDTQSANAAVSAHVATPISGGSPDAVTASISGGTVKASSVYITAEGTTSTSNLTVGVAAGGGAGVGGAVSYTRVHDKIVATADLAAITAGSLSVSAMMMDGPGGRAADAKAIAAGGGIVGIGAGVADIGLSNIVSASVNGTINGDASGDVSITAEDQSSSHTQTVGVSVGVVAVGISVANASKTSTVTASTGPNTNLNKFNNVTVSAANSGALDTEAEGAAGGGFAATGAVAISKDKATVSATLGAGTEIPNDTGSVTVEAKDTPNTGANSLGVAVASGAGLGISVATASVESNVTASAGDDVTVTGSGTLSITAAVAPPDGGNSANAFARSGTGGYLLGLAGAGATAKNNANVAAETGTNVGLPDGDVVVDASNTTNQYAFASGVAVGSLAGGAADAEADSNGATTAMLGGQTWTNIVRGGALHVTAEGNDTNYAKADAGTYGLAAGNASVTKTVDNSTVTASIGTDAYLVADVGAVSAKHVDNYSEHSDSESVSVAGASGATAEHHANVDVSVGIGHGVQLFIGDRIELSSENDFARLDGESANGGAGGVVSGAGVKASTDIHGTSRVNVGTNVLILTGTDPIVDAGRGISILAASRINGSDTVKLTTGGALQGAGTENDFTAQVDNSVNIAGAIPNSNVLGAALVSNSDIGIGTFTQTNMTVRSLASSYSIAAVADAIAHVNITSNQSVVIGGGANLFAYGNIGVTPGRSPTGSQTSDMQASSQAVAYVRAIIPIPIANATSDVTDNVSLDIQAGAQIQSGQNTGIGAYAGNVAPTASGSAQAYILGFIPVTGGTDRATPHSSSTITMNGSIVAGVVHDFVIDIPNCALDGIFCNTMTVSGMANPPGTTTSPGAYSATYSPFDFVATFMHGDAAAFLIANIPAKGVTVGAVGFNPLYASGGQVFVEAETLTGHGSINAYGGPTISITNESPDYLQFSEILIPDIPGGHVLFTGAADHAAALAAGLTVSENNPDGPQSILIEDFYTNSVGFPGGTGPGPGIFLAGSVQALAATLHIKDPTGSLAQVATTNVGTLIVEVPLGVDVIQLPTGQAWDSSGSIYPAWKQFIVMPGSEYGHAVNGLPSANWAVAYAVNYAFQTGNPILDSLFISPETVNLFGLNIPIPGTAFSILNSDLANYLRTPHDGNQGVTILPYGRCFPAWGVTGACNPGDAQRNSPLGLFNRIQTDFSGFAGSGEGGFSAVPVACVQISCLSISGYVTPSPSGAAAINANQIFIEATYIDIDSKINVGAPTDWSIHLPASLNNLIANAGPGIYALPGATVVAPADSQIGVSYDGTAHKILVNKVTASAQAAASIKLVGGIISTTTFGNIHVNAGLGKVTIQNDTTAPVEVQDIYTGLASRTGGVTGSVEIYDTLTASGPNHWWYIFTPGVGTNVYSAFGQSATLQNGANFQYSTTGQSFSYSPQSGTRWEWAKMGFLAQDVSNIPANAGSWYWTDPSYVPLSPFASDPWYWVDTIDPLSAVAGSKGALFAFNGRNLNQIPSTLGVFNVPYPTTILATDPGKAGHLTTGNNPNAPNFMETITGGVGLGTKMITNADCMWRNDKHCYSFGGNFNTDWTFDYLGRAFVKVTVSVKADNPIGIDFGGQASGLVSIISSAPVTINGQITNPNGTTTIASIFGGITSSFAGSIKSNNLNLSAGGSIGTPTQPLVGTLTPGGVLDAVGNSGVYLDLNSAVNVSRILAANGNISLRAQGDIVGVGPGTKVAGNAVNLQSVNGAIGTLASPLTVRASGRFDASALHDITIEQVSGNLAVGEVASLAGDVSLTVDAGVLLDAAGTTAANALSDGQIQDIWSTLHLSANYGSVANAAHTVTALENNVNDAYQQYWVLLSHGSVQNGVFVLDAPSVLLYGPVAAASGLTAQAYADGLYQRFAKVFTANIGVNWQTTTPFVAFDKAYHFQASPTQVFDLTGNATWTDVELSSPIPLTALAPSQNTSVGSATANASGHILTLDGSNGIGNLGAPLPITIADLKSGNLTLDQKKALALAKTPGDVSVSVQDVISGITHLYSLDTLPEAAIKLGAAVITGLQIRQTVPFFINETTKVDAHAAQGSIYLQESSGSMTIGTIAAGTGDVSLTAPNSILNVTPGAPFRISGNVISLLAGSGDIGGANDPIIYKGAALASASAAGSIYIDVFGGDLVLGRVFAGNTAVLDAPSGGISASLGGVTIQANDLILHARNGAIGSLASPLQIDVANSLNGDASGAAYLFAPHTALHIGDVTASGDLSVTATAGLTADPLTSLNGNVTVASGGDAELDKVDAAGTVNATAVGALTLGNVSSGGATSLGAGGAIVVLPGEGIVSGDALTVTQGASLTMGANSFLSAVRQLDVTVSGAAALGQLLSTLNADHAVTVHAGTIAGNGDSQTNIGAKGLLAKSYLAAASGIGSASRPVSVDTPWLNLTTTTGDIYLAARSSLIVPNIVAPGVFSLSGSGALTLGSIAAGKDIAIQAVNNIDVGPLSNIAGDVLVKSSAGALHGGSIATTGNTMLSAVGAILFTDINAGKTTALTAGGSITAHNVISTGGIGINAGKDITFNLLSSSGGDVSAKSTGGAIHGGSTKAGGNTTLTAAGAILVTDIDAGKSTALTAGDAVTVHNITSTTGIGINAGKDITFNLLSSSGGAVSAKSSGGAINGGSVMAAGSVTLTAAGAVVFTNINAGQGILIVPSAGLAANAVGTTDVSVTSLTGAIHGNSVTTPGSVMLDAAGVIVFTDIDAGGDASLTAGGGIDGHHLAAAGIVTIQLAGGTFHIADLKSTDLNLTSPGALVLDNLQIGKTVNIYAPSFDVHIVHTGSGPLLINAAGAKRDTALSGNLDIDSPGGIVFGHYNAVNGVITTNADMVLISNGHVTGTLKLTTLRAIVLFDNTSPTPHGGNLVQLFAPAFDFVLLQDGLTTRTNAYTVGFGVSHAASVTNFTEQHTDAELLVTGPALIRDTVRFLADNGWSAPADQSKLADLPEDATVSDAVGAIDIGALSRLVSALGGGAPVNLSRN